MNKHKCICGHSYEDHFDIIDSKFPHIDRLEQRCVGKIVATVNLKELCKIGDILTCQCLWFEEV
jgi:hypothetical protein